MKAATSMLVMVPELMKCPACGMVNLDCILRVLIKNKMKRICFDCFIGECKRLPRGGMRVVDVMETIAKVCNTGRSSMG
jgi:hypothetical protein